jgi:hypothetical protein
MKRADDIQRLLWAKKRGVRSTTSRTLIPIYRVGAPFHAGRRRWPKGAQFTHSPGGHELTLFQPNIDEDRINDVRQGEAEFALIVELPLIVLTYRFGKSIPWDDVPYSWHLQPPSWRVIPAVETSPEARALLWITLVGANDGIIYAQRGVTLSPAFTRSLHNAIQMQAMMDFNAEECTTAISKIFVEYPQRGDRLALAQARTMGNE